MATESQNRYIADLVVVKLKEFKEVKELLISSDIIGQEAETVKDAQTIAEITNALTDLQASRFIDILVQMPEPKRSQSYSENRINKAVTVLDDIQESIRSWDFNT